MRLQCNEIEMQCNAMRGRKEERGGRGREDVQVDQGPREDPRKKKKKKKKNNGKKEKQKKKKKTYGTLTL